MEAVKHEKNYQGTIILLYMSPVPAKGATTIDIVAIGTVSWEVSFVKSVTACPSLLHSFHAHTSKDKNIFSSVFFIFILTMLVFVSLLHWCPRICLLSPAPFTHLQILQISGCKQNAPQMNQWMQTNVH